MRFVFDLDGTVCFKGQPISNRILHSLSELTDAGIEVIFLTVIIAVELWSQEFLPPVTNQIRYSISAIQNFDHTTINDLELPLSKEYDYNIETNYIEGAPENKL